MLRPEFPTTTPHRQHVTIDGRTYILTQWAHLQAVADRIECPVSSGWAVGHVGNVRLAAYYPGGGK